MNWIVSAVAVMVVVLGCHSVGVVGREEDTMANLTLPAGEVKEMGKRDVSHIHPDHQNNTEVVTQVGGTVVLKCYAHLTGNEMVTWLKRDEDYLLTAGTDVYSSDKRVSVAYINHRELWELSLRDAKLADAGLYECQLTTHPPTSVFFTLKVVEARAVIKGSPALVLHKGYTLRLDCVVEDATEPPLYIFWFHNGSMINFFPNWPVRVMKRHYGSSLVIANVTWSHAGIYRCEPHLASPASLSVTISGEPSAMQMGKDAEKALVSGSSSWRCLMWPDQLVLLVLSTITTCILSLFLTSF